MSAAPSWLELLLRGAALAELEAHRRELLATGVRTDEVEAEAGRAFQLHAQLRDRALRVAELAALSDIATRLTSVRDMPELLSTIAAQARVLLRSDVTYLALAQEGQLRIRYFDGMLGSAARDLRLSMTAGLVGRIFASGKPSWTSDYLADRGIEHDTSADEFAREEQLCSILGVPLHSHGEVLGVLFAAERTHRPFADPEISLLAGLAAHAAVALENARLFEAERDATEELRTRAAATAQAIALHDRLTETAVRGGGPSAVVDALAAVLQRPVQLIGADDLPRAGSTLTTEALSKRFSPARAKTVVVPVGEAQVLLLSPIIAAEEYLGCLVVRTPTAVDAEIRLVERGALVIALSLIQEQAVAAATTRSRSDFLIAVVEGGEEPVLARQAAAMHIDLRKPHVLALVEPEEASGRAAALDLANRRGGLAAERAGRIVLFVTADTDLAALAACATVAVSEPLFGLSGVPEAYAGLRRCLQAMLALGKHRVVAGRSVLGIFQFLLSTGGTDEAGELIRRTIGPLADHDAQRGTDLVRTLEAYLDSGRQHSATAEALHIHPNTLYQRLHRIDEVLGPDWRRSDQALIMHVALTLQRLASAI